MVLTEDGTAVVVHVDRAGIELRDVRGSVTWVEWPDLRTIQPIDSTNPAEPDPPALRGFAEVWTRLSGPARTEAMWKLAIVQELMTGYRNGHQILAVEGEPSDLFDPTLGSSVAERATRMAERLTHEARTSRGTHSRPVSVSSVSSWVRRWETGGLLGLVDGRRLKTVEAFSTIPWEWRRVANDVIAELDGDVSTVSQREINRRIKAQLAADGREIRAPERAAGQYISHLVRHQGRTTRAQRSNKLRGVGGTQSYPAMVPGQMVAIDVTRSDVLVWCPTRGGPCSVEIISAMDTATRMILALRVVPMSADSHDAAMLLYDVMRPFSQVVEGTTVSDWAWAGVPEQVEFYADESEAEDDCSGIEVTCPRSCRRLPTAAGLHGTHVVPAVQPSSIRADHGSIFVSQVFRELLARFGIDLALSRTRRPIDNGILERYHETLQRGLQQLPGYKGRNVAQRGRVVGTPGADDDEPLLTAGELERWLRSWIVLDYHRTPHSGLRVPGAEGIDLRPVEMFDALLRITGRLHVPQRPDLIYDFLPIRWGTVRSSGVEFEDLVYDCRELDGYRNVVLGTFREQDAAMPFHYDPHDVSRVWFRTSDTGRIVEVPWRRGHLVDAPLTESLVREVRGVVARRGSARLRRTVAEDEIIAELGTLLDGVVPREWRKRIGAARLRRDSSARDHTEAAVAMTVAEGVRQTALRRGHEDGRHSTRTSDDTYSVWADSWALTPDSGHALGG